MAIPFFLNIIGLVAQLETVIAIQTALVNLARERQQPTTGIDFCGAGDRCGGRGNFTRGGWLSQVRAWLGRSKVLKWT